MATLPILVVVSAACRVCGHTWKQQLPLVPDVVDNQCILAVDDRDDLECPHCSTRAGEAPVGGDNQDAVHA
jgi:hypothetical protein